jgi:hypothetical protein
LLRERKVNRIVQRGKIADATLKATASSVDLAQQLDLEPTITGLRHSRRSNQTR